MVGALQVHQLAFVPGLSTPRPDGSASRGWVRLFSHGAEAKKIVHVLEFPSQVGEQETILLMLSLRFFRVPSVLQSILIALRRP